MAMQGIDNFTHYCEERLNREWEKISALAAKGGGDFLDKMYKELKSNIIACLRSQTKSYHYVLPTQLLSKVVDHSKDSRSLQASYVKPGAFDARTIAHKVIVPFDKKNHNVLGGSNEPYVNNPLRYPGVTGEVEARQKNKKDWVKLVNILDLVEKRNDKKFTEKVFRQVLLEIFRMLSDVTVIYPTPSRISHKKAIEILNAFITESSGGDRTESVATALFQEIGNRFDLFDEIKREKINAPDSSSGMAADIECFSSGQIVLLVEVKDRSLTMTELESKLDTARAGKIKEILFVVEKGSEKYKEEKIEQKVEREFVSGHNVYIAKLIDFAYSILILFGEEGRGSFIRRIGTEMDRVNSLITHRKAWAKLLREI